MKNKFVQGDKAPREVQDDALRENSYSLLSAVKAKG
jgi:hypothetical protein